MKMKFEMKQVIATVLIVANVIASSGFAVFAGSVSQMVYDAAINEKELKNYYYLYQEEQQSIRYYAEYDVANNISDDLKDKVKMSLDDVLNTNTSDDSKGNSDNTSINDANSSVQSQLPNGSVNDDENDSEEENKTEAEEPEDDEQTSAKSENDNEETTVEETTVKETTAEEQTTETTIVETTTIEQTTIAEEQTTTKSVEEETTTKSTEETSEEQSTTKEETSTSASEETTTTTKSIKESTESNVNTNIVEEETTATTSDTDKEDNKEQVDTATNSTTEKENVATASQIVEEQIATQSETVLTTTATESEIVKVSTESEIATVSVVEKEVEIATYSKVVIATVAVVTWKVEKIFLSTVSEIDVLTYDEVNDDTVEKDKVENHLAKTARVLVKNNLGETKVINVNIKWKLKNSVKIATRTAPNTLPFRKDKWQQELGLGKYATTKGVKAEDVKATDDEVKVVDKIIDDLKNEHGEDSLIVIVKATASNIDDLEVKKSVVELEEKEIKSLTEDNNTDDISATNNSENGSSDVSVNVTTSTNSITKENNTTNYSENDNTVNNSENAEPTSSIEHFENSTNEPTVAGFTDSDGKINTTTTIEENNNTNNEEKTTTTEETTAEETTTEEATTETTTTEATTTEEVTTETTTVEQTTTTQVISEETTSVEQTTTVETSDETTETSEETTTTTIIENSEISTATISEAEVGTMSDATDAESLVDVTIPYKDSSKNVDKQLDGLYDLVAIETWTLDTDDLNVQILNVLNGTEEVANDGVNTEVEEKTEPEEPKGLLETLSSSVSGFFGSLFGGSEDTDTTENTSENSNNENDTQNNVNNNEDNSEDNKNDEQTIDESLLNIDSGREVINEINFAPALTLIPEVTTNDFGLFGSGTNTNHPANGRNAYHAPCGISAGAGSTICDGHIIDVYTRAKTSAHSQVRYNTINASEELNGKPEILDKTLSTISVTEDWGIALLNDPGDDKFTLTHPIEVKSGVNLYVCMNGVNLVFASASKIFGQGNIYICNCREDETSTITAEKEFLYLDQFGIKWPATMSRIINREEPLVSGANINIYGTDTDNKCNLVFDDVEIRNNFRNNICKDYMKDDYTILNWTISNGYGSVITAAGTLNLYDVDFKDCISTRSNGIVNAGRTSYIMGCNFKDCRVTEMVVLYALMWAIHYIH